MAVVEINEIGKVVSDTLGKIIGDKSVIQKAAAEIELEIQKNKKPALSIMFEKGAIPALYWLFLIVMLNNMFIVPYVEYFTGDIFPKVTIDPAFQSLLETVTIWLFGKKGVQKVSEHLKKEK